MRIHFLIGTLVLILFSSFLSAQSITKPEVLKFGDTKSNIMLALNDMCKIVADRKIDPIKLPTAKTSQSQLDCEKFHYAGKKRKMEVIFADDILDQAWILIEPEEEDTLVAGFTALYGEPTHINKDVTFFLNDGVAVRNDPHEVLFISDRLKVSYKAWLEQKSE